MRARLRLYYRLAKPGIVYGNVMTTLAAFLFVSKWHFSWSLLVGAIVGTGLIIAAACVFNNYIDRDIDARMARTRRRASVTGEISVRAGMVYASVLLIFGLALLAWYVNWLTVVVGVLGVFFYVVVYGYAKRQTIFGTLVGSISGSMPMVAGYTAVADRFDAQAALLFCIMAIWQLPHFYAIAMYRLKDYQAAGLPVWPVKKGLTNTKYHIVGLIGLFTLVTATLSWLGYAGWIFLVVMLAVCGYWLQLGLQRFHAVDDARWARGMFGRSLVVLLVLSAALSVAKILP
jgi:protoheme IX farnesyltransferase